MTAKHILTLSVLWSQENLGAVSETDSGFYLAWGEAYEKDRD